jgi:hypothetical protein
VERQEEKFQRFQLMTRDATESLCEMAFVLRFGVLILWHEPGARWRKAPWRSGKMYKQFLFIHLFFANIARIERV